MATTKTHQINSWSTFHDNGPFAAEKILVSELEKRINLPSKVDRYNDATKEIQKLIKTAANQKEGFRALGSTWSLSHIAHHPQRMHINIAMKLRFSISPQDVHPQSPYTAANLFFIQCGNTIKQISEYVNKKGKSLKTSGASNGQTIAGCISTGVHGSGLNVGSVQDFVVGIQIIKGIHAKDVVYLERHSKPALTKGFLSQFQATVIRNDNLFDAALVGLGSMGFIHGVVIETEDLFLLKRYVKKVSRDSALKMASTMDFEEARQILPHEVDAVGQPLLPYHYKLFINPYNDREDFVAEFIYKKPYKANYPDPLPRIKTAVYSDLITLFTRVVERFPRAIPLLIQQLAKGDSKILPKVDQQTLGTLKETFWDTQHAGPAFACSVGVDHRDAVKAYEALAELTRREGPIPGIYAMRFVKQSQALLAFTRFPITCMLEIDGILWKGTTQIISLEKFAKRMLEVLEDHQIPYTLHWGKNADWGRAGLVDHMYGENGKKWKTIRSSFLTRQMARVFSNPFLKEVGLDEHVTHAGRDLVANLDVSGNPLT